MRVSFGRADGARRPSRSACRARGGQRRGAARERNPPPPKRFEAASASFVSAQAGFVLGTRHCGELPCKALLRKTVNGGRTWTSVPAPAVSLVPPFTAPPLSDVSTVRFENASDGWLFNPGLWATTDGGAQWHRVSLPGEVIAVAAADGMVFAAAEPVNGGTGQARLYQSQVGTAKSARVAGVAPAAALTVSGRSSVCGRRRARECATFHRAAGRRCVPSCRSAARPMPRTPAAGGGPSPADVRARLRQPVLPAAPATSPEEDLHLPPNGGAPSTWPGAPAAAAGRCQG